jgi:hypothetical protein
MITQWLLHAPCGLGLVLGLAAIAACGAPPADSAVCSCTPGNLSRTKLPDGTVMDGAVLLDKLRSHREAVRLERNARDVKLGDDELRLALVNYCSPCGDWIKDRLTVEEMFPRERLDEATDAVCLGLVLRDGTTAHGKARPAACR